MEEVRANLKYVRVSPQKCRLIVDAISLAIFALFNC